MPPIKKRFRSRKKRRNPLKRLLNQNSKWIFALLFLGTGIFLGHNIRLFQTPSNSNSVSDPTPPPETQPIVEKENTTERDYQSEVDEINKLTKQLLTEQKKTEVLSQKLSSENIKLKDMLKKSLQDASNKDQKYIEALNNVKKHKQHTSAEITALTQSDYYNKVRISLGGKTNHSNLQNKVNTLIDNKPIKTESGDEYIKELVEEAEVRRNEVRTISLKKGDTLWSLARRAYGTGSLYTKILEANPLITKDSFTKLQIGTQLRVPK